MSGTSAGALGALIGLGLGLFQFWIAGALAQRKLEPAQDELAPDNRAAFQRQVAFVRRLLFWPTVMVFPVVGYVIGRSLGTR